MKNFLAILALVGCLFPVFANEEWQGFAEPFPIWDVQPLGEFLMMATEGGMRYKGPDVDALFTSEKGLETSSFYAVTEARGSLYAVSKYGLVARFEGIGWTVVNRSYLSRQVSLVPGELVSHDQYLVMLFEDAIAIFNVDSNVSLLQMDRIGDISLSIYAPRKIALRNDTLFVSTVHKTYARKMDWENLSRDVRLVDPTTWTHVDTDVFDRDSLHVYVHDKPLTDSVLFRNGVSRIRWTIEEDTCQYLIGSDVIFKYKDGTLSDVTEYSSFKLGGVYDVQAIPEGGVVAVTADGRSGVSEGTFWSEPSLLFNGLGNQNEAYNYRMKDVSVLGEGMMMVHIWGQGMFIYREMGEFLYKYVIPLQETCMDQITYNYSITVGTTIAPDKSGFFAATVDSVGTYGLIYITKEGDVSCAKNVGSTRFAGPLVVRQDGSDWIAYVSAREALDPFALGALDVIRFKDPSKNGGRINTDVRRSTIANIENRTPVDLVLNEKDSVLWMVSTTSLSYMKFSEDSIYKPNSTNGLHGAEYSAIDIDPQGNVWLASTNQGAYRLHREGDTFDTLSVSHYTSQKGLLSNAVLDVSVDKKLGMVWFSHENGITRYKRSDLRDASTFMTDSATSKVKAYPVPFRPKVHSFLTIDNVDEKARVDIYNRGGSLIRSFNGDELAGGKVEWDGTGKNGWLVAPGVYYYVVRTSSKKEKGKFIIIH